GGRRKVQGTLQRHRVAQGDSNGGATHIGQTCGEHARAVTSVPDAVGTVVGSRDRQCGGVRLLSDVVHIPQEKGGRTGSGRAAPPACRGRVVMVVSGPQPGSQSTLPMRYTAPTKTTMSMTVCARTSGMVLPWRR